MHQGGYSGQRDSFIPARNVPDFNLKLGISFFSQSLTVFQSARGMMTSKILRIIVGSVKEEDKYFSP
jgi:hypothetical protein